MASTTPKAGAVTIRAWVMERAQFILGTLAVILVASYLANIAGEKYKKSAPSFVSNRWQLTFKFIDTETMTSQYTLENVEEVPKAHMKFAYVSQFAGQGYTSYSGTWNPHVEIQGKVRQGYHFNYEEGLERGEAFLEQLSPTFFEGWTWTRHPTKGIVMDKKILLRRLP